MVVERLTTEIGPARWGHEARYHLASGFLTDGGTVIDVACGTGYGADILAPLGSGRLYVGVDIAEPPQRKPFSTHRFIQADLETWEPDFDFDVAVCFETLEHLADYYPLIDTLKLARRWVIASVPIVPTVGVNEWHRHDFVPGELAELFEDWDLYQTFQQPSEVAEVCVFRR